MFTNGRARPVFNARVKSYQRHKMVLDPALLNTQNYKVQIKGKVE